MRLRLTRLTFRQQSLLYTRQSFSYLAPQGANYVPLTPLSFINHSALHFPSSPAYLVRDTFRDWELVGKRVKAFASALRNIGVNFGDVVSIIAPNCPSIFEAHFAVPGLGCVLHSINVRQEPSVIAYQLIDAQVKYIIVDSEYGNIITEALKLLPSDAILPVIIDSVDPENTNWEKSVLCGKGQLLLEDMIDTELNTDFQLVYPKNEFDAISLNYTSGTTGKPKGVLCHHRGAYLNAIGNMIEWSMS